VGGTGVFAAGTGVIDVSGWTEASNGFDGSVAQTVASPLAFGPILAIALRIDSTWYVVPDSMAMYSGTLWRDSIHTRTRVTAELCRSLVADGEVLEDIAMVVVMRGLGASETIQQPGIYLGNWGISVDPFISLEQ
jgi:hypothetical protein